MTLWGGAAAVAAGSITGGTILSFIIGSMLVAGAFGALTEVYGELLRGAGAASRLSELLEATPNIAPPPKPQKLPNPSRGSLSFRNVTFSYPTRLEATALKNFTLEVQPGETVAIVGPSGAGKSTIFQLAERFYDPQVGTIRLDGIPLSKADPADVRDRIAFVPQDGVLFSASARDNLRYGKWAASDDEIWEAARAAHAEPFLRDLPKGLATYLGENGTRLSGGQQQRAASARAVCMEPSALLFDEPTSALDPELEQEVIKVIKDLALEGRTMIIVTHDMKLAADVSNHVVFLHQGLIEEEGSPNSLFKSPKSERLQKFLSSTRAA